MNNNHDEYEDRLIDMALRKKFGDSPSSELTERILKAVEDEAAVTPLRKGDRSWLTFRYVACSLCVVSMLILAAVLSLSTEESNPTVTQLPNDQLKPDENLAALVAQFNKLIEEQRYAEAEIIAQQAKSLAPDSPVVETLVWKARFIKRIGVVKAARDGKEGFWSMLQNVEDSGTPFDDESAGSSLLDEFEAPMDSGSRGSASLVEFERKGIVCYEIRSRVESSLTRLQSQMANNPDRAIESLKLLSEVVKVSEDLEADVRANLQRQIDVRQREAARLKLVVDERRAQALANRAEVMTDDVGLEERFNKLAIQVVELERNVERAGVEVARHVPNESTENQFSEIVENPFVRTSEESVSTFSIDVDTASYAKVRDYLLRNRRLPPAGAVRIEELLNYFDYKYAPPKKDDKHPFTSHIEVAECPWESSHQLVRIGIKGREFKPEQRPATNLVFLIDVSGSMEQPNKLPLVKEGMKLLTAELGEKDRVAIVVYAAQTGVHLESIAGDQQITIRAALDELESGGSTNGEAGIQLAYKIAKEHLIKDGVNRVVLCTDGDFNVGTTATQDLVQLATEQAAEGVFLSILGFGMDNHNDEMLEAVSNNANGNYAFIDSLSEAHKVLVEQMSGTLVTIAKDVKIQVQFNPKNVESYRLIGYENRVMENRDFDDDQKDAGEIGAGHSVTALYEITLAENEKAAGDDLLNLRLRYKQPKSDSSTLIEFPVVTSKRRFGQATRDFQFTAAVASFGMLLRDSKHKGDATIDAVAEIATAAKGDDQFGYRNEFLEMVSRTKELMK